MDTISNEEVMVFKTIRGKPFQSITIQVYDGKIVTLRREETIKPDSLSNRNQSGSGEVS